MVTRSLLTSIAALSLAGTPLLPPAGGSAAIDTLPRPVYVAHRGGALEVPENSMSGLLAAYRRGSAHILDVDVRRLRDGTLVAMHDRTLDRTTDKRGPVRRLTLAQWRKVRLLPPARLRGAWKAERPPTVPEVLDRLGGKVVLMLEVKDPRGLPALARELRLRGLTRSVFVNTNSPDVARRIHAHGLLTQLWRSAKQMRGDRPSRWRGFVDTLDVDYRARARDLRRAAASGIPRVWAHTVNTPRDRDRALRLGCNGIITDAPGLLTRGR
ncbi:glycerophosphodiester phosphodiesterase family protein [Streptomyces sp. GC420]|uniref:glycerophosphodiester phosphodiesterase n=1 Tax=Streptomyces sp. GC420 TaxID=2697568 RepID=UPI001414EBAA|nr:glycerophosphodiester phosphodiesterase family protein [Streptomyces sp. GC420]NBM18933.1 glycerophosphodiester phosphodiesterase [Streptomyces sp. GC420]